MKWKVFFLKRNSEDFQLYRILIQKCYSDILEEQNSNTQLVLPPHPNVRIMLMVDRAKRLRRVSPTAICYFTTPDQDFRTHHRTSSSLPPQIPLATPISPEIPDFPFEVVASLDFGQYVDFTPLSI